jgi:hypothetical protein
VNFWRENNEKVTLKRVQNYRYIYLLDDVLIGERGRKMEAWWHLRTRGGGPKLHKTLWRNIWTTPISWTPASGCRSMQVHADPYQAYEATIENGGEVRGFRVWRQIEAFRVKN